MLLSTLKAYFEGKKELFIGLAVEKQETEWTAHPVLHLSFNAEKYTSAERRHKQMDSQLMKWEALYGTEKAEWTYSIRFMNVIEAAYRQTGKPVVVLIYEYDKPILKSMHDKELQEEFCSILVAFYSVLKDADPFLRLVFITGVTKFAQMSIFSTLNQLKDISLDRRYESLCGLTRQEIEDTFSPELDSLAADFEKSRSEAIEQMTIMYDGYRFSKRQLEGIFNPFSVLNLFDQHDFSNYWFFTGTPGFLVGMLQRTNFDVRRLIDGLEVSDASLTTYQASDNDPVPMQWQC